MSKQKNAPQCLFNYMGQYETPCVPVRPPASSTDNVRPSSWRTGKPFAHSVCSCHVTTSPHLARAPKTRVFPPFVHEPAAPHSDRLEEAGERMAAPVCSGAGQPVDRLARLGQQLFCGAEHTLQLGNNFRFQHHLVLSLFLSIGQRSVLKSASVFVTHRVEAKL